MINVNPDELIKILNILKTTGLDKNVVLIGSWAEMFYEEMLNGYEAMVKTMDVDFLYLNIHKPIVKIDFTEIMFMNGFGFSEDTFTGKTKFISQDLELEFLSKLTRDNKQVIEIKNLGIGVECIGGLEIYDHNYITYTSEKYGVTVNLPTPAAYCMHKILINHTRTMNKAIKDAESVKRLLPYVLYGTKGRKDFLNLTNTLSKKQIKSFKKNINDMDVLPVLDEYFKLDNIMDVDTKMEICALKQVLYGNNNSIKTKHINKSEHGD